MDGLRLEYWPEADRRAWQAANTPSEDPWDADGVALTLRPKTRRNYQRAWGIYLAHLDGAGQLLPDETPAQRVTPTWLQGWLNAMRALNRQNGTIKLYFMSLHAMMLLIAPGTDTRFILHPGGRSLHELFPTWGKTFVPYDTADLLERAARLHQQAMANRPGLRRSKHLRDAAIMAVLYSRAPRVSDLAAMRIGEHLRIQPDGSFLIHFLDTITKNHRTLEYPLDPGCAVILNDYLVYGRPNLRGADATGLLWMGTTGRPLNAIGITGVVRRRNRDFIDLAEGPHMARKWLTDTARNRSPEAAFDAAEVLGHSPGTALKHYAAAQDAYAGKRHGENVSRLRRQTEGLAERAFAARDATQKEVEI